MRVLLTGAGGFVGSHVLEHLLLATGWDVIATDSFRHKGKTDRIAEVLHGRPDWRPRLTVITHDLSAPFTDQMACRIGPIDYVLAVASESAVERSIEDPVPFVRNNVNVALSTLEYCRLAKPRAVIWVSTDEVYGPVRPRRQGYSGPVEPAAKVTEMRDHPEWDAILPSNPYSASKAAQEAIAIAYWRSYGVPMIIVNCMNLIGERQDPEKYLPTLIRRITRGEQVTVHGREGDIGSRHYLHARNLADGMLFLLRETKPAVFPAHLKPGTASQANIADRPDRWNIVGPDRVSNLELAQLVAEIAGRDLDYQLVDFHSARPGHDPHYGLDPGKLTAAGWKPPVPFRESLARAVRWSLANPRWLA